MSWKPQSTPQQIEEFKQGPIWNDMSFILGSLIDTIQARLEVAPADEISWLQGSVARVRDLLELPDELTKLKEADDE